MAVTAADLTSPVGEIEPAVLWPGELGATTTERLTAYVADGELQAADLSAGASRDAAVKAWAYYRAYMAVYIRLTAEPTSKTINDQASESFSVQQIQNWKDMADAKLATFTELVDEATDVQPTLTQPTVAARTVFTW